MQGTTAEVFGDARELPRVIASIPRQPAPCCGVVAICIHLLRCSLILWHVTYLECTVVKRVHGVGGPRGTAFSCRHTSIQPNGRPLVDRWPRLSQPHHSQRHSQLHRRTPRPKPLALRMSRQSAARHLPW